MKREYEINGSCMEIISLHQTSSSYSDSIGSATFSTNIRWIVTIEFGTYSCQSRTYYQYPLMDHRGTAYAIADQAGNLQIINTMDAFGRQLAATSGTDPNVPNILGFQTNWVVLQIGGRWYGISKYRIYDFELGIFLSQDFLRYPNKYRAWSNNPVDQIDSNGLASSSSGRSWFDKAFDWYATGVVTTMQWTMFAPVGVYNVIANGQFTPTGSQLDVAIGADQAALEPYRIAYTGGRASISIVTGNGQLTRDDLNVGDGVFTDSRLFYSAASSLDEYEGRRGYGYFASRGLTGGEIFWQVNSRGNPALGWFFNSKDAYEAYQRDDYEGVGGSLYGLAGNALALKPTLSCACQGDWLGTGLQLRTTPNFIRGYAGLRFRLLGGQPPELVGGRLFENQVGCVLRRLPQFSDVRPQVTIRPLGPNGIVYENYTVTPDFTPIDKLTGRPSVIYDPKFGGTPENPGYTPLQTPGYPLIQQQGGIVVGNQGLPALPPGFELGPTPVLPIFDPKPTVQIPPLLIPESWKKKP